MSDGKELKENEPLSGQENEHEAMSADNRPTPHNEAKPSGAGSVDTDEGRNERVENREAGESEAEDATGGKVEPATTAPVSEESSGEDGHSGASPGERVGENDTSSTGEKPPKSPANDVSLAAMKLVDVDASEGIQHAKQTLNELEALLDEFENPSKTSTQQGVGKEDNINRITPVELDKRLEEVTTAVAAAAAANKSGVAMPPPDTGKGRGSVVLLGLLTVTALVLSVMAFLQMRGVSERLDAIEQSTTSPGSGRAEEVARMHMEFQQLSAKFNELAAENGGATPPDWNAVEARLSRLEQQLLAGSGTTAPAEEPQEETTAEAPSAPAALVEPPRGGRWVINLTSFASEDVADEEIERLRDLGIQVEKHSVVSNGKVWYRLRITGLATYESAKTYMESLRNKTDIGTAWINKE